MENELDKQTAVQWLIHNIVEDQTIKAKSMSEWIDIFKQAKQMEKEQIMDAHYAPKYGCFNKDYYQQTYESKNGE
jgi:hypothetical protein